MTREECNTFRRVVLKKNALTQVNLIVERLSLVTDSYVACWRAPRLDIGSTLGVLCRLATSWKVRAVQLVDYASLAQAQKHSEEEQVAHVYSLWSEFGEYAESLLAFDLDSLAGMSTEFSGMQGLMEHSAYEVAPAGHTTVSYRVQRSQLLEAVLSLFNDGRGGRPWLVAISKNNELTRRLKEKCAWRTESDIKARREQDERRALRECVVCRERFAEEDNHDSACARHGDYIVCYPANEAAPNLMEEDLAEYDRFNQEHMDSIRRQLKGGVKPECFRWRCCGAPYHQNKGELPCRHTTQITAPLRRFG